MLMFKSVVSNPYSYFPKLTCFIFEKKDFFNFIKNYLVLTKTPKFLGINYPIVYSSTLLPFYYSLYY
jgi:hypothetical protein